jgi:hypothetical protein
VNESILVIKTLFDGLLSQIGESDRVLLAATVDRDQIASFEIKDVSANSARSDIDRVIVG